MAEFYDGPGAEGQGTTDGATLSCFFFFPLAQRVSCLIFRHDELCAKWDLASSRPASSYFHLGTAVQCR